MTKLFLAASVAAMCTAGATSATAQYYKVDTDRSELSWEAKKLLGGHQGTLELKLSFIEVKDGLPTFGSFEVPLESIVVEDLGASGKAKLKESMFSADFFNVNVYPTAQVDFVGVNKNSETGVIEVVANLTIAGITEPVRLEVIEWIYGDKDFELHGRAVLDRQRWDLTFDEGGPALADPTIKDDFTVRFDLVGSLP